MKLIETENYIENYPYPVVVMGNFDGVHDGHKQMIQTAVSQARQHKGTSVVCIFNPHTKVFFAKITNSELLMTQAEKVRCFEKLGVDVCIVFQFTKDFSLLTAEDFIKEILIKKIGMKQYIVGHDTHFGSDKKGDINHLEILGKKYNFTVTRVVPMVDSTGKIISSTGIRNNEVY